MRIKSAAFAVAAFFLTTTILCAQSYSTDFEQPGFTPGDGNGQNGWGHISNSPTDGFIENVPAGSPAAMGVQALAIRTRNKDFFGVTNHFFSAIIDPASGETGSTIGGVPVVSPQSTFRATFWYRTPATPPISNYSDGRFIELDPSSKGTAAGEVANRYAQIRIINTTNTALGLPLLQLRWITTGPIAFANVATLSWDTWYRFEYVIQPIDGLNGAEANDRFQFSVYSEGGTLLGSACGSTWEAGYKSGTYGGGSTPRGINGFDFWSLAVPNGTLVGYIDNISFASSTPAALQASVIGTAVTCGTGTTTLTAGTSGGVDAITAYEWRDASNAVVGTGATLLAGSGTYTVAVTDSACATATSAPFTVTAFAPLSASIAGPLSVCFGSSTTLSAVSSGGSGSISSYSWRDASNNVVGTSATLAAGAGTYILTITDAQCGQVTSVPVTVQTTCKATPVITWGNPAAVVYGTPLGALELNATANVPGSFTYAPPAGTILHAGSSQLLSTDFSPADSTNYNDVNGTVVHIDVNKRPTTLSITSVSPTPSIAGQAVTVKFLLSGTFGSPGGSVSVSDMVDSCTVAAGSDSCTIVFTTTGSRFLTATYSGDGDHFGSSSAAFAHRVNAAAATAVVEGSVSICKGSPAAILVTLGGTAPWTIKWSDGLVEQASSTPHVRTVSPAATTTYTVVELHDAAGPGTSSGASTITVITTVAPSISTDSVIATGQPATLHATPGYASYQWFRNQVAIAGETSADFTIPSVSESDLTAYSVTGTREGCTSTQSAVFTLLLGSPNYFDAIIPIVGKVPGDHGSNYRTAVHLYNPTDDILEGEISFIDTALRAYPFSLLPRETRFIPDLFPASEIALTSANIKVSQAHLPVVVARVFNDAGENGTSGLIERAVPVSLTLGPGEKAVVVTPTDPVATRLNIGIRSLADDVTLRVTRRDKQAGVLETVERKIPASTLVQQSADLLIPGARIGSSDTLTFEIVSGRAVIYGTSADNRTNDPEMQLTSRTPSVASKRFLLPVAGSTSGQFGSYFATGLQIHNPTLMPFTATLTFHPAAPSAVEMHRDVTLQGGETLGMPDVVAHITSVQGQSGLGSLDVAFTDAASPVLIGRVYSVGTTGETSFMTNLVAEERFLSSGDEAVILAPHSPDLLRFNVGVRAMAKGAEITATIRNKSGVIVATVPLSFAPDSFSQEASSKMLGYVFQGDESVTLRIDSGDAVVYGVWTDNVTQDPSMQYAVRPFAAE